MPLPDRLARLNRLVTNPVSRLFAGRIPPFAVVEHRGRRTGSAYRTPVWAFATDNGYVVALTYGSKRDWVKNVLHEGGCALVYRGRRYRLGEPVILDATDGLGLLPAAVRPVLRFTNVDEFLRLVIV